MNESIFLKKYNHLYLAINNLDETMSEAEKLLILYTDTYDLERNKGIKNKRH